MARRTETPNGRAVIQRRESLGWSQEELAEKSGVSPATVARVEHGTPTFRSTLTRLAQTLEMGYVEIVALSAGVKGTIHLDRTRIPWGDLNDRCRSRFWAAGTSLQPVANRGILPLLLRKRKVKNVKLILPVTDADSMSLRQLMAYNDVDHEDKAHDDQVGTAQWTRKAFLDQLAKLSVKVDHHLRFYPHVMYSNLTLIDDTAFISFYDDIGNGDRSVTLEFDRAECEGGFALVEGQFKRMWDASSPTGSKTRRRPRRNRLGKRS